MARRAIGEPARWHAEEFKLSVTLALKQQLTAQFDGMPSAPLTGEALAGLEGLPGVYELFWGDRLVYIGKADNLPDRLSNHLRKLRGRVNIDFEAMAFRCVYVEEDLSTVAPERMLIDEHRLAEKATVDAGGSLSEGRLWNTIGFGNKDPGRNRDKSMVKDSHFDYRYPINLDYRLDLTGIDVSETLSFAAHLKSLLPYNFRFDAGLPMRPMPELGALEDMPARDAFAFLARALPEGWAITALPGYVIGYREDPAAYDSRIESWRADGMGGFDHEKHMAKFSHAPLAAHEQDAPAFDDATVG